jgi:subtilisin family serine protease
VSKLVLACIATAVLAAGFTGAAAARPSDNSSWSTYIITLRPATGDSRSIGAEAERRFGGSLAQVYTRALSGFAITIPDSFAARLASDPRVLAIEQDAVVTADVTQSPATWGLDRIDQRALPLNNSYTATNTGAGVTAYIIDTGILLTHTQFGGRAVTGYDAVTSGGSAIDCNGHGTHVAGTVGGKDYGVADGVRLVAVRVLDCGGSGTTAGVIAGIDWVTGNHVAGRPAVANMSLGGGASSALDTAVKNSIADGVAYAVAAGNGNASGVAQKACNYSPARVPDAMTVGATDSADKKASWSNYGTCVDWFAPGVSITSSWYTSTTATNTISGTSMATPHTAGVAALYLQSNPGATPLQVRDALAANATTGVVTSPGTGSPNRLLFESY